MEKFNLGKCRNHFWFVIFFSLVFWFYLFYFNSPALISIKNKVRSLQNDYWYSVVSRKSSSLLVAENSVETISQPPGGVEPINPVAVTEDGVDHLMRNNVTEPINQLDFTVKGTGSFNRLIDMQRGKETGEESIAKPPINQVSPAENGSKPVNRPAFTEEGDESIKERRKAVVENRAELVNVPSPVENRVEAINQSFATKNQRKPNSDPCSGRYIYAHKLPSRFNDDLIKDCRILNLWIDMCRFTSNMGLGPPIFDSHGVFSSTGWYNTNQFTLGVIFNHRMKHYQCLTNDSSLASAIYVPFYAGLDVGRFLWGFNTSMRDSTSLDLVKWLKKRPEWKVLGGKDHFLVAGRITWDFRRLIDEPSKENDWGNKLMVLPEAKNMSMLVIESSPWHSNDFAIPYPTYFHPSTDSEVFQWQNKMRRIRRRHLFSFAGAPRPNLVDSIRNQIIDQCRASRRKCMLLECYSGVKKCDNPSNVMKLFQSSKFCLQPSGDSFTRRSTFDSMLAGCIPVFFHPGSAYVQYTWHLPQNYTKYSVFISENDVRKRKVSIQKKLLQIPKEEVKAMREEVIRLIPRLIYADPRSRLETLKDALDLAVEGVIRRANKAKREIRDGVNSDASYAEENNWKYNLFGTEGKHEWDPFFVKPKDANS